MLQDLSIGQLIWQHVPKKQLCLIYIEWLQNIIFETFIVNHIILDKIFFLALNIFLIYIN